MLTLPAPPLPRWVTPWFCFRHLCLSWCSPFSYNTCCSLSPCVNIGKMLPARCGTNLPWNLPDSFCGPLVLCQYPANDIPTKLQSFAVCEYLRLNYTGSSLRTRMLPSLSLGPVPTRPGSLKENDKYQGNTIVNEFRGPFSQEVLFV